MRSTRAHARPNTTERHVTKDAKWTNQDRDHPAGRATPQGGLHGCLRPPFSLPFSLPILLRLAASFRTGAGQAKPILVRGTKV